MPALKGSLTYSRFFVNGELPKDFRERFMRAIRLRAMKPLEPDDDAAERSGWCAIGEPFDVELGYEGVFYNSYLNLGFRTDRWVIPGPLLRARLREAEQAYLLKRGRERLSKREKVELKEVVSRKLRKQFVPVTRAVDFSWCIEDGVVRFFSQSQRAASDMTALFQKTFNLELAPEAPYTLAARIGLDKSEEKTWEHLEVTQLVLEGEAPAPAPTPKRATAAALEESPTEDNSAAADGGNDVSSDEVPPEEITREIKLGRGVVKRRRNLSEEN
ncbi:MAG: hypothetical protein ABW321_22595 [Polyangiales bacterium]